MTDGRRPNSATAASLLSTTGAGVAGVGLGILLARPLAAATWLILAVGLVAHLVGMVAKNRIEARQNRVTSWWEPMAYWGCWVGIVSILGYGLVKVLT